MFCEKCGQQIREGQKFCPKCGAPVRDEVNGSDQRYEQNSYMNYQEHNQRQYRNQSYGTTGTYNGQVSFMQAVVLFFKNYTNFAGRSTRSEYWWVILFQILVYVVWGILTAIFTSIVGLIDYTGSLATGLTFIFSIIQGLFSLAIIVPGVALNVRRLHDTGKPWYWLLCGLIPVVGTIVLIVFNCQPSVGDNQWGRGPESGAGNYRY